MPQSVLLANVDIPAFLQVAAILELASLPRARFARHLLDAILYTTDRTFGNESACIEDFWNILLFLSTEDIRPLWRPHRVPEPVLQVNSETKITLHWKLNTPSWQNSASPKD